MRFEDKIVLITGGNKGIGFAAAKCFTAEGAKAVICARDENAGKVKAEEIGGLYIKTDVTKEEDCKNAVSKTISAFGKLDILVNCAGIIFRNKTPEQTSAEEWDATFNTNVKGAFLMTKHSIPELRKTKGTIVSVSSYVGLVGFKGASAYAASKAALVNFTRSAALDYAEEGIRVNCICPGSVETGMIEQAWIQHGNIAEARKIWEEKHPLKRIAAPEEAAKAILFLAGSDASFITGAAIPVDGGITAG